MGWQEMVPSVPHRNGVPIELEGEEQFQNDLYVVTRRKMEAKDEGSPDAIVLSIRRQDRQPVRDWRDFQRIKNQLAGPEWTGVEIYPAESRKVDGANQYWIWCLDVVGLGFGFSKRVVGNQYQAERVSPGAVQRDPEPVDLMYGGLTKFKDFAADNPPYEGA